MTTVENAAGPVFGFEAMDIFHHVLMQNYWRVQEDREVKLWGELDRVVRDAISSGNMFCVRKLEKEGPDEFLALQRFPRDERAPEHDVRAQDAVTTVYREINHRFEVLEESSLDIRFTALQKEKVRKAFDDAYATCMNALNRLGREAYRNLREYSTYDPATAAHRNRHNLASL